MLTRMMVRTLPATALFGLVNLGAQVPRAKASLTNTLSPLPNLRGLLPASHSEADQFVHCNVFNCKPPHAPGPLRGFLDSFHCIQPWSACCYIWVAASSEARCTLWIYIAATFPAMQPGLFTDFAARNSPREVTPLCNFSFTELSDVWGGGPPAVHHVALQDDGATPQP